jgi:hypothetical protein
MRPRPNFGAGQGMRICHHLRCLGQWLPAARRRHVWWHFLQWRLPAEADQLPGLRRKWRHMRREALEAAGHPYAANGGILAKCSCGGFCANGGIGASAAVCGFGADCDKGGICAYAALGVNSTVCANGAIPLALDSVAVLVLPSSPAAAPNSLALHMAVDPPFGIPQRPLATALSSSAHVRSRPGSARSKEFLDRSAAALRWSGARALALAQKA